MQHTRKGQGMAGSVVGHHACIRDLSEVDYTADLRKIDRPMLVIHGDDDQIVANAVFKADEGAPHGLASTHPDRLNAGLLAFARS